MSLRNVDLNLLVALDHLLRERNVSRAAKRMGLSQPAMSACLRRLRETLDDPLLVRGGRRGMIPTERALALAEPVRAAIAAAEHVFVADDAFDPMTDPTRFTVAMSDYPGSLILPTLGRLLANEAAAVEIRIVPAPTSISLDDLESGLVSLVLGFYPNAEDSAVVHRQHLFDDDFVLLARRGHPAFRTRMTAQRFADLAHVLVAPQGQLRGLADERLRELGLERRIALRIPHFQLAPAIVSASDLVVLLTRRIAGLHTREADLEVHPAPITLGKPRISQHWHRRVHTSAAHRWLRSTLVALTARLDGGPG